ncbi:hypothetical protein Tco_1100897 [Tanacetum coccineum]
MLRAVGSSWNSLKGSPKRIRIRNCKGNSPPSCHVNIPGLTLYGHTWLTRGSMWHATWRPDQTRPTTRPDPAVDCGQPSLTGGPAVVDGGPAVVDGGTRLEYEVRDSRVLEADVARCHWWIQLAVTRALDVDPFNPTIREDETEYLQAFTDALLTEECFLKQKAKIEWLRVSDSNTAYFHMVVKSRASRNRIDSITAPSGTCIDGDQVPMAFIDHYMAFLGQKEDTHPFNSNDLFCNKLSDNAANHMIRAVSSQEVCDDIFSMGNDKSPGPDGYTAAFLRRLGILLRMM